ncbi:hypothetical protein TorRG33x02_015940, partial [Trema orientale]
MLIHEICEFCIIYIMNVRFSSVLIEWTNFQCRVAKHGEVNQRLLIREWRSPRAGAWMTVRCSVQM